MLPAPSVSQSRLYRPDLKLPSMQSQIPPQNAASMTPKGAVLDGAPREVPREATEGTWDSDSTHTAHPPEITSRTFPPRAPEIRNARGCASASMPGSPEGALTREEPVGHGRLQHQSFPSILASIDAVHL